MEKDEYIEEVKKIDIKCEKQKYLLDRKFALATNTIKVGDTIKDHIGSIIVETVKFTRTNYVYRLGFPQAVFQGLMLKADGKPRKNRQWRSIYADNLMI